MKTKRNISIACGILIGISLVVSCKQSSHQQMVDLLKQLSIKNNTMKNAFNPDLNKAFADSLLKLPKNQHNLRLLELDASLALKLGHEEQSVKTYDSIFKLTDFMSINHIMPEIAIAYMRLGERNNCMLNHNGSSCVYPIKDEGVHKLKTGSTKAIETYKLILQATPTIWNQNGCLTSRI